MPRMVHGWGGEEWGRDPDGLSQGAAVLAVEVMECACALTQHTGPQTPQHSVKVEDPGSGCTKFMAPGSRTCKPPQSPDLQEDQSAFSGMSVRLKGRAYQGTQGPWRAVALHPKPLGGRRNFHCVVSTPSPILEAFQEESFSAAGRVCLPFHKLHSSFLSGQSAIQKDGLPFNYGERKHKQTKAA